jgi:dihydropteroate synthase
MVPRPAGVLRLGRRSFEPSQLLVMTAVPAGDPADTMDRVHALVAGGTDILEVAGGPQVAPFVATIRDRYPELVLCVRTGRREVAREACAAGADLLGFWDGALGSGLGFADSEGAWASGLAEVAAGYGAGVICPPGLAARVVAAGAEPERVVIGVAGALRLAGLVATGWPVLVALPDDDLARDGAGDGARGLARGLGTAAVAAWLGARVFRVPWMRETRRVLRMVSAIRGDVPPARAVRGLA